MPYVECAGCLVESAGCLMLSLLGVLCRVCWVSCIISLCGCELNVSCEEIISSEKNSTHIYSKSHFHHKSMVVPRSDDFFASLFTIMLNDSVLLHL